MSQSRFTHVTSIRTTPETLGRVLTGPEFTRQHWVETVQETKRLPETRQWPEGR